MGDKLIYERGDAEPGDIEQNAREIWNELVEDGELEDIIAEAGGSMETTGTEFPFEFERGSAGIVVSGTTIVVGILSPVAANVLTDVWRNRLLPLLLRKLGAGFIGDEKVEPSDDEDETPKT